MKVLILSCTMGQGHNSAGRAVYEELIRRGACCEFVDALSFAGERVSRSVSIAYSSIANRTPRVFDMIYRAGDFLSSPTRKSPVYHANELYRDSMCRYIVDGGFDTIVMSHLFPAQTLTSLKIKRGLNVRTLAISTDYTCIPFWEETDPDRFTIAHPDLIPEYAAKGIPAWKLMPLGIPVSAAFAQRMPREQARRQLGLPDAPLSVLIMPGILGHAPLAALVDALDARYGSRLSIAVLTGVSAKLCGLIKARYAGRSHIRVLGCTPEVSLYMDASDLVFTKPGGLTSTEAAVKNIPIIMTAPIPGCETKNAEFFERRGIAAVAHTLEEQLAYARRMLNDPQYDDRMRDAQRTHINPNSANAICDHLMRKDYE